jgi:hypothetical protein
VIALVVAVSAALTAATGSLGFLFAFGLQTLFFWALFIYRKQITGRLVSATTGGAHHEGLPRARVVQRGAAAAATPVTALVGLSRRGSSSQTAQQESALAGAKTPAPTPARTTRRHLRQRTTGTCGEQRSRTGPRGRANAQFRVRRAVGRTRP